MRKINRIRSSLVATAVAVAITLAVIDWIAGPIEAAQLRSALGAMSGVHVATIDIDAAGRRLALAGLRVESPDVLVEIGRVALPRPRLGWTGLVERAEATSDPITLDDIRVTIGDMRVVIPHIEIKGSTLSAAEWRTMLDPAAPDKIEDRLAKLSASEASAREVAISEAVAAGADPKPAVVLHDVLLDDVTSGRIGTLTLREILAGDAKTPPESTFKTGVLKASQIDLPLAVRLVKGQTPDPAEVLRPMLGSFELAAMSFVTSDLTMTLDSLRSGTIQVRPFRFPSDELSHLLNMSEAERSDADKSRILELMDETVQAIRQSVPADHVEMRRFAVRDSTTTPFSLDMDRLAIDGAAPAKVDHVVAETLVVESPDVNITLGRVSLEGYDQTQLLEAIQRSKGPPGTYGRQYLKTMPTFDSLSFDKMHVDAQAKNLDGNADQGRRVVVDVPSIALKRAVVGDTTTGSAHAQIVMDVPPESENQGVRTLIEAGFSKFDLSFDSAFSWSPASEKATLDRLALSGVGLGAVSLTATFGQVKPQLLDGAGNSDAAAAAVMKVEVETLRLDVGDAGLAAKAWSIGAKAAGISVPLLKAEAKGQIEVQILKALCNIPAALKLTTALSAFIDDPKTLTVSVKAPAGLNLQAIAESGGGRALLDLLDIDADANR